MAAYAAAMNTLSVLNNRRRLKGFGRQHRNTPFAIGDTPSHTTVFQHPDQELNLDRLVRSEA
jgi:hypothetical protein